MKLLQTALGRADRLESDVTVALQRWHIVYQGSFAARICDQVIAKHRRSVVFFNYVISVVSARYGTDNFSRTSLIAGLASGQISETRIINNSPKSCATFCV